MSGKVILVGAGPGDPGLLTLRGREAIMSAEVVVYDRLVGPEILEIIPGGAELINAGKASSRHLIPQEQINRILLEKALEGKNVVRLKGGDPFLFGRGGEELEALLGHGVDFEVVPGVPSAIAAPSYAGIPVTHRDICSSVHIITAHGRANRPPDIKFDALVKAGGTLVFLMGVTALGYICDGLLGAGMRPDMPAAAVESGTLPAQRRIISTLGALAGDAAEKKLGSPAVIIVGEVCSLSDDLCRFEKRPLFGRRIAVTRPRERAGTLSARLRALGADVVDYPCIATVPIEPNGALDAAMGRVSEYEWLVFTSPAGVGAALGRMFARGLDARSLAGVHLAAIGSATARELGKFGLRADYVPEHYSARELGRGLAAIGRGKTLILRAREGSPYLTGALEAAGLAFDDVPVYDTVYESGNADAVRAMLAAGELDAVTFTSASTVRGFVGSLSGADFSGVLGVCIGEQTTQAAEEHGIKTIVAKNATIDELVGIIVEKFSEVR